MKETDETQVEKKEYELNMKLTIPERMATLGILPEQGNFADLKIVQGLKMDLSFSEKELTDWDIRSVMVFDYTAGEDKGKVTARDESEAKKIIQEQFPTITDIKITPDTSKPPQIAWGKSGADLTTFVKDFSFGKRSEEIIVTALKKFSNEGKLTPHHISVYEKFIKE